MIKDEDGYCTAANLKETLLSMMPSGRVSIELLNTYEVEPADLNSDDDGDIEAESGESELEEFK